MNQIGYHIVDNQFTEAQINQHFGLINDTRPAAITILGGAQYKEALSFAIRAKAAFPAMRVVFRHYKDGGDDGMHTRLSADEWWQKIGSLYIGTGLTILSDNESMSVDLSYYAKWQARVMQLAGAQGVGIGYGAFSTHNPPTAQIPQLKPMFEEAAKWGDLHTYSAHAYYTVDNWDGMARIREAIDYMQSVVGRRLDTTVGEFALLRDVRDAHHGWRSANVSGKVYALDMVIKAKTHLKGIPVCAYSIGQWPINADTFSLDKDALDTIKTNLTSLDSKPVEPPIVVTPPPIITPPLPTPTGPVPNAQGQYDLLPFLRGSGVPHLTKNNWSGDEVMWTEIIDDRLWLQRKNDHSEEFGLTATHIVRGLDTSPGGGWAYVLTNLDDSQGSPWSPRWMKPGDVFYREAIVKFFRLTDGSPGPSYVDKTYLKFVKFHPTWTSWAGLTIANMVEFEVYNDNRGVPGFVWERYAFSLDMGLVGWQGGDEMKKMMGIAAHDGSLPQKPRMKLGWYPGLTLPPVVTPPEPPPAPPPVIITADDPRWERYTALAVGNVVSNIRALPTTQSAIVDTLEAGITTNIWHIPLDKLTDIEKVYSHDVAFRWWAVKLVDRVGWIRQDAVTLKPVVDPPVVISPPPPADTTPVPNALLLAWREEFEKRADQWEDIEHGAHQQATLNRGYVADIDKLLEVQKAA